ncbi:MAG: TnpV protein [Clostridia bacterium]|nr:TnpV protein [Clostridia bacterium]
MKKYKIDECTGWEYELKGDYYYPTGRIMRNGVLTPGTVDNEPEEKYDIGVWGKRHLRFIRQHKKSLYLDIFLSGKLNAYLAVINAQAEEMFARLVKEMAACEGVNEQLKAEAQMRWVGQMNSIRNRAMEIVNHELIFI